MDLLPELTLSDLHDARKRIAGLVIKTPIHPSNLLDARGEHYLNLKLENLQTTGSFKLRGASNKIMSLADEEKDRGVVTISSGNHGRAVSYVSAKLGIRVIVCVSRFVPEHKIEVIQKLGAEVLVVGKDYDEADAHARKLVREEGMTWIDPFDDPDVIAGQGTIGLEILEEIPEIDTVIVPTSGGGLISGIAIAIKLTNPKIRVIGVTMERGPAMYLSLEAGRLVPVVEQESLADALAGGLGEENHYTFRICQEYVDKENLCVTVTPTKFFYTNGNECGAIVGLINYPRFPSIGNEVEDHAFALATQLKEKFKQKRVSVVCCGHSCNETFMIGELEGD